MANTIQIKRKTTSGAPSPASLATGEMCWVDPDNEMYIKKASGSVVLLNGASSGSSVSSVSVDIGQTAVAEFSSFVVDTGVSASSKVLATIAQGHHADENFGVPINIFCVAKSGGFDAIITPQNPRWQLKGVFKINYQIQ